MVHLDGFSGYGGFSLGLEQAGFKFDKVYFSEIDKRAIANYSYNFPNAIYAGSITTICRDTIPHIDFFTFGWPCQDNSIAGKRKGQSGGTRSGLLNEAVRIINEYKPRHFIAENVPGLTSVNKGYDYIEAIRLLSYLNESCPQYDLEMQLCNTREHLPQNRERLFFVGHSRAGRSRQIFPLGVHNSWFNERSEQTPIVNTITAGGHSGGLHSSMTLITSFQGKATMPTIRSSGHCSLTDKHAHSIISITANTKAGYEVANEGDSINFSMPNSTPPRGRVGHGVAQTLDTQCNQGVIQVNKSTESGGKQPYQQNRVYDASGISPALNSQISDQYKIIERPNYLQWGDKGSQTDRAYLVDGCMGTSQSSHADAKVVTEKSIRRLTPTECERLQGLPDGHTKYGLYKARPTRSDLLFREQNPELWAYHTKAVSADDVVLREISDSQRYKLCGNGVSIPVVKMIATALFNLNYK